MIQQKKKRRTMLTPVTGRQAFKGIIQPLLLGGGGGASITPQQISQQYQQAGIALPEGTSGGAAKINFQCEMSSLARQWCNLNPFKLDMPWCEAAKLSVDDPKCGSFEQPKCPMTDRLKAHCEERARTYGANNPDVFCRGRTNLRGECFEQAEDREMNEQQEKENKKKIQAEEDAAAQAIADAKAEQDKINNWKVTRGCKFQKANLTEEQKKKMIAKGINPITTKTPCTYPQFTNAELGQIVSIYGQDWKFLGWSPERP